MTLERDFFAKLLADCALNQLRQRFTALGQNERAARRIPAQLEAFRMRRNPDLANRSVRADHELRGRVFELDRQRAGVEIGFEIGGIGSGSESSARSASVLNSCSSIVCAGP